MKCLLFFMLLSLSLPIYKINGQVMNDDFTTGHSINIGNPALSGKYTFSPDGQMYLLEGTGVNMWGNRDEFFFLSKPFHGDLIFSANIAFEGTGVELHRKAGLMFRATLDDDSPYIDVAIHGDGLTSLQYRLVKGGETAETKTEMNAPEFVQLEKKGKKYILRLSKNNQALEEVAMLEVDLGEMFHVGMFVCSHNSNVVEKARFWNVRVDVPEEYGARGSVTNASSRLELLTVGNGMREVIYTSDKLFEAPNWSRNGKFLIYNQEGKLYRFNLKSKRIRQIDTGFADANNNDHGISFCGKTLAISHHTPENGSWPSIIYTVPVKGGTPRRITPLGPSYWHGWSPDDRWLVYCAERNGEYDVYKIPVEGGDEIRLTNSPGLDDGPEYSPCGKYIYFNSVRTGTMQIWRMGPDGSNQEQVTFDEYNDWFPHPSPDGKWILFISYGTEVPAGSHPRNKRVMLRIMPAEGGEIRTVAFLYGGQGTINVPSWSPDSKQVAFVSYTF